MKKLLMTIALTTSVMMVSAQGSIVNGAYENKEVREYPGVSAETLYVRALEALSDWAGTQSKSNINIDVQDKEEGLVVYKGKMYLGFHKSNAFGGWDAFADFTLKIRCKDGKAQLSCHVPTLTIAYSDPDYPHVRETVPLGKIIPKYTYKQYYRVKKAAIEYAPKVKPTFDLVILSLGNRLAKEQEDF